MAIRFECRWIRHKGGKRMQGTVVEVLERKQTEFVGKLEMNKGFAFFVAEGEKPMPDIFIPEEAFIMAPKIMTG